MFTAKSFAQEFYMLLCRFRDHLKMMLSPPPVEAKPIANNKANYKYFEYCANTFVELSKQMYEGKDIERSAIALIKLHNDIEREADPTTYDWLIPSLKAVLGQRRFQ